MCGSMCLLLMGAKMMDIFLAVLWFMLMIRCLYFYFTISFHFFLRLVPGSNQRFWLKLSADSDRTFEPFSMCSHKTKVQPWWFTWRPSCRCCQYWCHMRKAWIVSSKMKSCWMRSRSFFSCALKWASQRTIARQHIHAGVGGVATVATNPTIRMVPGPLAAALPVPLPAALPVPLPAPLPVLLPAALPVPLPAPLPVLLPAALPVPLPAPLPVLLPAPLPAPPPALPSQFALPILILKASVISQTKRMLRFLQEYLHQSSWTSIVQGVAL